MTTNPHAIIVQPGSYLILTPLNDGGLLPMVTMFIKAKVRDYGNWKRVYDDFAPKREEKGVTGASVFRDADAPDTVTVIHQFANLTAARAFAVGEEMRSAMIESGLEGNLPDIWFTEDVEQTAY